MICPRCGSRQVGCLPGSQYYCWRCFIQFAVGDNTMEVYEVEEDGTLVSLGRVETERAESTAARATAPPPTPSARDLGVESLKPGR